MNIRAVIVFFSWLVIVLCPQLFKTQGYWFTHFETYEFALLILIQIACSLVEMSVFLCVAYCFWNSKGGYRILSGFALGAVAMYVAWIIISSVTSVKFQTFLTPNHLVALSSGTKEFFEWLPRNDLMSMVYAVCVALLICCGALFYLRHIESIRTYVFILVLGSLTNGAIWLWIAGGIDSSSMPPPSRTFAHYLANTSAANLCFVFFRAYERSQLMNNVEEVECITAQPFSVSATGSKRNIVLIVVEALRADILVRDDLKGVMPTVREMGMNGILFKNAYAASSESSYSNVAILTGLHSLKSPWRDSFVGSRPHQLPLYEFLPLDYKVGYFAPHSENWQNVEQVVRTPRIDFYTDGTSNHDQSAFLSKLGFHTSIDVDSSPAAQDGEMVGKFSKWISSLDSTSSFFSRMYFVSSHFPYHQPPESRLLYEEAPFEESEVAKLSFLSYPKERIPRMWRRYLNSLHYVDSLIAELRDDLERAGRLKDTTIIVTGDHGQHFGEHDLVNHANSVFEPGIKVPLIFSSVPGWHASDVEYPVSHIDIAPTILQISGATVPSSFQGHSILFKKGQSGSVSQRKIPIISSIQSLAMQDAFLHYPFKIIFNYQSRDYRAHNLALDPGEQVIMSNESEEIRGLVLEYERFRKRQFWYFSRDLEYQRQCAPPGSSSYSEGAP
jgi:hypothetical protein